MSNNTNTVLASLLRDSAAITLRVADVLEGVTATTVQATVPVPTQVVTAPGVTGVSIPVTNTTGVCQGTKADGTPCGKTGMISNTHCRACRAQAGLLAPAQPKAKTTKVPTAKVDATAKARGNPNHCHGTKANGKACNKFVKAGVTLCATCTTTQEVALTPAPAQPQVVTNDRVATAKALLAEGFTPAQIADLLS